MARTLNGVEIYDPADLYRDSINTEVLSTIHRIPDLALLTDGSTTDTATIDAIHKIRATLAGGVGGAWTEESNWQTLLAAKAPVIAEATDNLDANANCIFTPWGGVTWAGAGGNTLAASAEPGVCGSSVMEVTHAVGGYAQLVRAVTVGQPYTESCFVKAGNAGAVGDTLAISFDGTSSTVVLSNDWKLLVVTDAAASATPRATTLTLTVGSAAGDKFLVCAFQHENKLYPTPFCLDSRTATTMTFPTASLGLVAGQDLSIVVVTRTPWVGNDGVNRIAINAGTWLAANWVALYKNSAHALTFRVYDAAAGARYCSENVDATDWPADTTHVVIATRSSAGVINGYLNGVAMTTQNAGAGTGLEAAWNANLFIGYGTPNPYQWNAPLLVAIYNRVLSANEISLLSRMGAWMQKMKGF